MKIKFQAAIFFTSALPLLAIAQSVIQISAVPYAASPDIQFEFPKAIVAPVLAMQKAVDAQPANIAPKITPTLQTWAIESTDVRLVDAFSRWTQKAGMQLRWDATRHVELGATNTYEGDVSEAMISALKSPSISNSDFPLEICFYPNKPILARVTRQGEQWRDCPLTQEPTNKK